MEFYGEEHIYVFLIKKNKDLITEREREREKRKRNHVLPDFKSSY